ncbi:unnamed protein product [Gordionus sp. m RMFG-2023]
MESLFKLDDQRVDASIADTTTCHLPRGIQVTLSGPLIDWENSDEFRCRKNPVSNFAENVCEKNHVLFITIMTELKVGNRIVEILEIIKGGITRGNNREMPHSVYTNYFLFSRRYGKKRHGVLTVLIYVNANILSILPSDSSFFTLKNS